MKQQKHEHRGDFLRTLVLLTIGFVIGWNHAPIERWIGETVASIRDR